MLCTKKNTIDKVLFTQSKNKDFYGTTRNTTNLSYKAFRHVETSFVQGRNLYLAGLLLVIQDIFTLRQPIAGLLGTGFFLERILSANQ